MGTAEYARLRVGVDLAQEEGGLVDHVLGRFRSQERAIIEDAVARAAQAVAFWIAQGTAACMNEFNAGEAGK